MSRLIVYGNCQASAVCAVLKALPQVTQRWQVMHHELWATGEELARNLADFDVCDVLLQQDVRNWRDHPRRDSLLATTQVVRFPFCYLAALWPFDGHQNGVDPGWYFGQGEAEFGFNDNLLGKLRLQTPDPEARYRQYEALRVEGLVNIARYADFEEARLLREDSRLGYTIGRFIVDNYRTLRLFNAITHPTPPLLKRMVLEILDRLRVETDGVNDRVLDFHGKFQVPLHPKVIDALGIKWADSGTEYNFNSRETLTFERYVRRYISVYG